MEEQEKTIKAARNVQRHAFHLTQNNPEDYGVTHHMIKETFITQFPTVQFFCMADEISSTGTYHTHIYVCFSSRVRISKIQKYFSHCNIQIAHGSVQDNIAYIKKSGKWNNTDKAETRVEGTYEEWGTPPKQKGVKKDMQELYELVKAGYSNAEILGLNNDYILSIDKIDKVRTTLLIEKYKNTRRLDLKVVYVSGVTGAGKTRDILDEYGDSNVYRVSAYQHPFDSYNCQSVLVFEEFRSQLYISDMLNYLDIYPIELPARYSNKFLCAETIFIVSNWHLEKQYQNVQLEDSESWRAFLRRIHEVRIYEKDGTVTVYDSVEEYLNREEPFRKVTKEEERENPFTQEELPVKE